MAIVASGEISLGVNATTTRSVACELTLGGTTQICMDQAAVRTLAARTGAGSAICMCNFYGKTFVPCPPALGGSYQGGYYFGAVASPANYYIIIAPNASGCACCQWKTSNTSSPSTGSTTDGYANTYDGLANADHPAGNWTATRSIGGFSDWYLPARDELNLLYTNKSSAPAGEGFAAVSFWSSTDVNAAYACVQFFTSGAFSIASKISVFRVRAVRRQSF